MGIVLPNKNARPKRPHYELGKKFSNNVQHEDLNIPSIFEAKRQIPKKVTSRSPSSKNNIFSRKKPNASKKSRKPSEKVEALVPEIAHSFILEHELKPKKSKESKHNSKFTFTLKKLDSIKNKYGSNNNSPAESLNRKSSTNSQRKYKAYHLEPRKSKYSKCDLNSLANETHHIAIVPNTRPIDSPN